MEVSKNFVLQEFIYPKIFEDEGVKCIRYIDERIVKAAQIIRDYVGVPVTINNWHTGGNFTMSGLRPFNSKVGAKMSQHKFGRAIDVKVQAMNGEEMRDVIKKLFAIGSLKGLVTTIEDDTDTWLHLDCRWVENPNELLIVPNPNLGT